MFCRSCGKEINDNDTFCVNCGAPAKCDNAKDATGKAIEARSDIKQTSLDPEKKRKKGVAIIAAVVAVVIITVAVVLLLIKSDEGNTAAEIESDSNTTIISDAMSEKENVQADAASPTESAYRTEIEKKIDEKIGRLEAENPETWRQAYIDFVDLNFSGFDEYDKKKVFLGYVDNDDVPELFVSEGSSHICTVQVYTFEKNLVKYLCDTGSFGRINYFEREGIICGMYYGMGAGNYWVYKVEKGAVEKLYDVFAIDEYYISYDGEPENEMTINGIDVTREEIDEFIDYYFSQEKSTWVFDETDENGNAIDGCEIGNGEYITYIENFGK